MICYAFPVAHEAELLLKKCTQRESFVVDKLSCTLANLGARQILIAGIGMGQARARENMQTVFRYFRPKAVVLAGYGGALVAPLKVGQVVISTNYTTEQVLPFLRMLSGFDFASFATVDELVGTTQKREWYARKTKGQVADMETAAVSDVVRARQVPFMAVRAISDDYQQVLPLQALAAAFDPVKGRSTPFRLLKHLALHVGDYAPFKKFVFGLAPARKNLTAFLKQLNEELPSSW